MQTASSIEQRGREAAVLAGAVAPALARAESLIDCNRVSSTYGCADRPYWYYRTLTNFPSAIWQQTMVGLAALYRTRDDANPHFGDTRVLEVAGATLDFWSRAGRRDGSYDEWYLNEHSYCPTAITGAGAAQTLELIGDELTPRIRDAAIAALRRAGSWLDERINPTVMNQNLAAATALAGLARFGDEALWRERAARKLDRVRAAQNAEGWFPEYSGADLGYSSLALDFLAAYHRLTGAEAAQEMAARLCAFLVAAQGGWICLGGRLGSRGTSHTFPYGALYFAERDPNAARLATAWIEGLARGLTPRPGEVDDRYFAYFYFPQFALAYHRAAQRRPVSAPPGAPEADFVDLPQSGFTTVRRTAWSAMTSRRLGGAVVVANAGGELTYHCGYEIAVASGKRFSTANWRAIPDSAPFAAEGEWRFDAQFRPASSALPLKKLMAPFQITVGLLANSALAEAFQKVVKARMIAPDGACPLLLERRVRIADSAVKIRDVLRPGAGLPAIDALDIAQSISMHSPSARQDRARIVEMGEAARNDVLSALNAGRSVSIETEIDGESGAGKVAKIL